MIISRTNYLIKMVLNKVYGLSLEKIVNRLKNYNFRPGNEVVVINGSYVKNLSLSIKKIFKDDYREMIAGSYENFLYKSISNIELGGKVVWDIGAHFGYHSFVFANLVGPLGKVYSFEPNPNNNSVFKSNLELNCELSKRIFLHNYAIADTDQEQVVFKISPYTSGPTTLGGFLDANLPPNDDKIYDFFKKINVQTRTIDQLMKQGLEIPDIIKIDVEGAEDKVLRGGINTLINKRPILIIEIHTIANMSKISQFLAEINYEYKILDEANPIFTKNILAYSTHE